MISTEALLEANSDEFKKYVSAITRESRPQRHKFYGETVALAKQMGVHVEGDEPKELLRINRPNEPEEVRAYRLKTWKPITKSFSDKIIHTVSRIFNPKFFRIDYPETPSQVPENESLGNYLNEDFGIYKSIWVFIRETLLKMSFSDPNSVCLMIPSNPNATGNEYYKPVPIIYRAKDVVDFVDGQYYTIYMPPKKDKYGTVIKDSGFLIIADTQYVRMWSKKGSDFDLTFEIEHGFGEPPAFRLGAQVEGQTAPYFYSSFIYGVQPHWDKVVTMTSDLDGSTVNHLFPSMWEWTDECPSCAGSGRREIKDIQTGDGKIIPVEDRYTNCVTCSGTGKVVNRSPYGVHQVKREALNPDAPQPIPPFGYVSKDIAPLQELKKSIEVETKAGFTAVNMEVLFQSGENQSGVAKTIDRQDLESFLMRVFMHIMDCNVKPIIKYTALWRYSGLFGVNAVNGFVNDIKYSKSKDFTVVGMDMLMQELGMAKSAAHVRFVESEIINNRFARDEEERKKNLAIINLKPFPNRTPDELLSLNAIGSIREEDFIRNENMDQLVTLAIIETPDFLDRGYKEQLEIIEEIIRRDYLPSNGIPVNGGEEDIT